MQNKRQLIINILKERGSATVDELSKELAITSVTVRHHLDVLRSEGLVSEPVVRHRATSGRPQHAYTLTLKANELFPKNYDGLAMKLLDEVKAHSDTRAVSIFFEGITRRLLTESPRPAATEPMPRRLEHAVEFLNEKGYVARWENTDDGYVVHTCNCPYAGLADRHPELCAVDMNLIASLVGRIPERVCHVTEGGESCSYLIRPNALNA